MRYRILARKNGGTTRYIILATFWLASDAYKYWDNIPACWDAKMYKYKELLSVHPPK